jgi:hypothetical protein
MNYKTCSKCHQQKSLSEFFARKSSNDGLQYSCKLCSNERVNRIRANNRDYMKTYIRSDAGKTSQRKHRLKKLYNLTECKYDAILKNQNYKCACCKTSKPGGRGRWHVDHCHDSGLVRGLLCHHCNVGIGNLGDSVEGIENALNYLKGHYDLYSVTSSSILPPDGQQNHPR